MHACSCKVLPFYDFWFKFYDTQRIEFSEGSIELKKKILKNGNNEM